MSETVTLQTYSLELIGPADTSSPAWYEYAHNFQRLLDEAAENLNDLMPELYSVRISEWDADER